MAEYARSFPTIQYMCINMYIYLRDIIFFILDFKKNNSLVVTKVLTYVYVNVFKCAAMFWFYGCILMFIGRVVHCVLRCNSVLCLQVQVCAVSTGAGVCCVSRCKSVQWAPGAGLCSFSMYMSVLCPQVQECAVSPGAGLCCF